MRIKEMMYRATAGILTAVTLMSTVPMTASAKRIEIGKTTSVNITRHEPKLNVLHKTPGQSTLPSSQWTYKSNDGITGAAYCVNWGLGAPSPAKKLQITGRYSRNPQTMGAFAAGYPQRTLEEFKKLHPTVEGINDLTQPEYSYATQVAIWATCGQISVPGTQFTAGRTDLVPPKADAQEKRVYQAMEAILKDCAHWNKPLYDGLYVHAEEKKLGNSVIVPTQEGEHGLEEAAKKGVAGIKKENINGTEYYTRQMFASSATSTFRGGYCIYIYSPDAPQGTIFTDTGNKPLETESRWGTTMYKIPTPKDTPTDLNANGTAYMGAFKVCMPVKNTAPTGKVTLKTNAVVTLYNLYLAYNPDKSEQSYIISDPSSDTREANGTLEWKKHEGGLDTSASLEVVKIDGTGNPLEGVEFTLKGDGGTTKTGTTDDQGKVEWTGLPADEKYTLEETKAPPGYAIVNPVNVTLTAGQTEHVTVQNSNGKTFKVKKIDTQNSSSLEGAVFQFEKIDGGFKTTGTTGFDGIISFTGGELPFGSYRVTEINPPEGYEKDNSVQTVEWTGKEDILLTFKNVRKPTIVVSKVDADTGVSLPGAVFDVYKDGKKITTVKTDDSGEARVTGITTEGYYEFVETVAPDGYVLDTTKHGIHVDPYDPATDKDPVIIIKNRNNPSLKIIKVDQATNERLPNVTFEVYKDADLIGTYQTDENGEINLFDLEPGTYLVKEVASDDDHVVNSTPQQIELKEGQKETQVLIFLNALKPGMHLIKVDSETMKPLPNAKFKISKVGGSFSQEFTTDEKGEIDLSKLEPGAYEVQEIAAPDGYLIDNSIRIIQLNPDETAQFVFTNTKKPELEIVKRDPDNDKPLGGASFRIAKIEDGSHYLDRVTDEQGKIHISGLEPGIYSVQEMTPPPGYVLNDLEYHVELFPGKTSQVVIHNYKKPNLKITKLDAITGKPIAGVQFKINKVDGSTLTTVTTGEDGTALLEALDPGVYQVTEVSVPDEYLLDKTPQLITLFPNETGEVVFKNYPKPSLTIEKRDSITKDLLTGAKFKITYASNDTFTGEINELGIFTTDQNGQILMEKLKDGWYRVEEIEPPAGYAMKDPHVQQIYVEAGRPKLLTFENTPLSGIVIKKIDADTGKPLEGAWFRVRFLGGTSGTGGTIIGEYVTSANGTAVITGLKAGTYVIEEISAPNGYVINDSAKTVYISGKDQDVITVIFGNDKMGSLLIKKIDSETKKPLSDVEFLVTNSDGGVIGNTNGKFVTDSSGTILIDKLEPGMTVVVKEIRTKDGYILDETPQTIKIKANETMTLEFRNTPNGCLTITKIDSVTREPISGVKFEIKGCNGCEFPAGEYITDANGQIKLKNVPAGCYSILEKEAPEGYIVSGQPQTIKVKGGDCTSITIENKPLGGLLIKKMDAKTKEPLADVIFKVTQADGSVVGAGNGEYRTDENGYISIPDLKPGGYVVKEVKAKDGYVLDDTPRTIEIKDHKLYTLEFFNQPYGNLIIVKKDAVTGEPLAGVEFEVTTSNGSFVPNAGGEISSNGLYVTDATGQIKITNLKPDTYVVKETKTIPGYVLNSTPQTVVVNPNDTQTLTFINHPYGGLLIKKIDSVTHKPIAGVTFQITASDGSVVGNTNGLHKTDSAGTIRISPIKPGTYVVKEVQAAPGYILDDVAKQIEIKDHKLYELEFMNVPIGGLTIIKTDEDSGKRIEGVTFEVRKQNGEIVGTYVTDRNGLIQLPNLSAGWYEVTEIKAAKGYLAHTTPQRVEVKDGSAAELKITNKKASSILIKKIDSVTKKGIAGVTFLISDANQNPLKQVTTDQNGYIYVDGGLTDGKYFIREIQPAEGYMRDDTVKTFYIEAGATSEIVWENTSVAAQIQITKKSADDNAINGLPAGTLLEGAVFEVYDKANNVVDTITTNEHGIASSKPLPLGRYTVREVKAPNYYGINPNTFTADLEFEGQIVRFDVLDESQFTNVSITKRGYQQAMSGQEIRYDFSNIANNSSVNLNSFYWRDTLPYVARLQKIVTGTYNQQLSYKITYKTNLRGYTTLADNLLTSRNYVFEASPVALGLASNEYVTEIMFSFGVVRPGFANVEMPQMYCRLLTGLANNAQFVNQADVGGLNGKQWIMATDRWVTTVYNPRPVRPPKLPRTGF